MLLTAWFALLIAAAKGSMFACLGHADIKYLMPWGAPKFGLNSSLGDEPLVAGIVKVQVASFHEGQQ